MLGALEQLGLSAVDNAVAHFAYLPEDIASQPGVVDRIVEPLLPFLAHDRDIRRGLFSAIQRFKAGGDKVVLLDPLRILREQIDPKREHLYRSPDVKGDAIAQGKRISDDVVFREQYLSRQLDTPVRVLTALGDLAMFTGIASNFDEISNLFQLHFWIVVLPNKEMEIRLSKACVRVGTMLAEGEFPMEGGTMTSGKLFFKWEFNEDDDDTHPEIIVTPNLWESDGDLSFLQSSFAFLDIDKRNLKFEFVEVKEGPA